MVAVNALILYDYLSRRMTMVQVPYADILLRVVSGEVPPRDGITSIIDRQSGRLTVPEGELIDFKVMLKLDNAASIAETARDILGFSNKNGGVLIFGVSDGDGVVVGHEALDFRRLRDALGPYIGTRVNFDLDVLSVSVGGRNQHLIVAVVHRSQAAYPNQLRKDIELRPSLVRKLKYVRGTLFYRRGSDVLAESPYGDIESRARELGFSGAAPRTRNSFLLQEDKPGLRLYAPINDRFFGREAELSELLSKFDDPRGRGVSIAGFGGIGKTELAIKLVSELNRRGKFSLIYSGSAKQTLLGPGGPQQTDPVFIDLPTFLTDLAGWLGFTTPRMTLEELTSACLSELTKLPKVLLFVDNLETVNDRELLSFLDNKLPPNCWIVATARVHKIRNFVYPKALDEMDPSDAARLLRHELKRQGLDEYSGTDIGELSNRAKTLYCHPLAIRWYAWACKREPKTWNTVIPGLNKDELETFCVAYTLGHLDEPSLRVLGAVIAIGGTMDSTDECIRDTSGVSDSILDGCLWELECSGLLYATTDENGVTTYSVPPLAQKPAADLARHKGWETNYVYNLQAYVRQHLYATPESSLVRDLLKLEPRRIQYYSNEERKELMVRIDRALLKCPERFALKLKVLKAECERHLDMPVSADDLYRECAEIVLAKGPVPNGDVERAKILLEAATVAKARSQSDLQIKRAVLYLEAILHTYFAPLRVLGMLAEMYGMLGDRQSYERYRELIDEYRESHEDVRDYHLDAVEEALARAETALERKERRQSQTF
jgi:hypothetical protein